MKGIHRRDDLLVEIEQVVRLAELEIHGELAEVRSVTAVAARIALVSLHHVVVQVWQRVGLEVIPEAFGVRDDALVDDSLVTHPCGQPTRGDADHLVVAKPIEIESQNNLRLEGIAKDFFARRTGYDDLVGWSIGRRHLEADGAGIDIELASQDLVDRKDLVEPAHLRINRLLRPFFRRNGLFEPDGDLAELRAGLFELGVARHRRASCSLACTRRENGLPCGPDGPPCRRARLSPPRPVGRVAPGARSTALRETPGALDGPAAARAHETGAETPRLPMGLRSSLPEVFVRSEHRDYR